MYVLSWCESSRMKTLPPIASTTELIRVGSSYKNCGSLPVDSFTTTSPISCSQIYNASRFGTRKIYLIVATTRDSCTINVNHPACKSCTTGWELSSKDCYHYIYCCWFLALNLRITRSHFLSVRSSIKVEHWTNKYFACMATVQCTKLDAAVWPRSWHSRKRASVPAGFWVWLVKILVFPGPTGYMWCDFSVLLD